MDMALTSNEVDHTVRQLQRELRLRTTEDAGNVSSGCSSPGTPATPSGSSLAQKLHQTVLHHTRKASSPCTPEYRKRVCFQSPLATGVSPSRTASSTSDSSTCGGTAGSDLFAPDSKLKEAERSGSQDLSLTVAPPGYSKSSAASSSQMDSKHCIGDAKGKGPSGNATSGEGRLVKPNPPVTSGGGAGSNKGAVVGGTSKGAGAGGCPAGAETAAPAPAPPKRKRKRKSKKPPTTLIEATKEEFLAKVQELTGMKQQPANVVDHHAPPVTVVRPQPKRPRAAAAMEVGVLIDIDPSLSSVTAVSELLTSADVKPSFVQAPLAVYQAPPIGNIAASHHAHADAVVAVCASSQSELNCTFGYDESSEMQQLLLMSMQEHDLNDIHPVAASECQDPADYTKAAPVSGINLSMHSPFGPSVPQVLQDSLSLSGFIQAGTYLCDTYMSNANDFATSSGRLKGADVDVDGEQDEDIYDPAVIETWIYASP